MIKNAHDEVEAEEIISENKAKGDKSHLSAFCPVQFTFQLILFVEDAKLHNQHSVLSGVLTTMMMMTYFSIKGATESMINSNNV